MVPPVAVSNTWISQPFSAGSPGSFTPFLFRSLNFMPRLTPACCWQNWARQLADGKPVTYAGGVTTVTAQLLARIFGYGGTAAPFTGNVAPAVFTPVHAWRLISPRCAAATLLPVGRASPLPPVQLSAPVNARIGAGLMIGGSVGFVGPIFPPMPLPGTWVKSPRAKMLPVIVTSLCASTRISPPMPPARFTFGEPSAWTASPLAETSP